MKQLRSPKIEFYFYQVFTHAIPFIKMYSILFGANPIKRLAIDVHWASDLTVLENIKKVRIGLKKNSNSKLESLNRQ